MHALPDVEDCPALQLEHDVKGEIDDSPAAHFEHGFGPCCPAGANCPAAHCAHLPSLPAPEPAAQAQVTGPLFPLQPAAPTGSGHAQLLSITLQKSVYWGNDSAGTMPVRAFPLMSR